MSTYTIGYTIHSGIPKKKKKKKKFQNIKKEAKEV